MKIRFLFFYICFPLLSFANDSELKICLTGSTEKALPKYGEAFVNGATLAINELNRYDKKKVILKVHYYDNSPLAPISKLEEMRKDSCDAIIGFSTGNDLLAVEDSLSKKPIFTLSIYGDPQGRFSETSYLRTMQPSANDLVSHLFKKFSPRINSSSRILIVTAVDRSEMISYKKAFLDNLKNHSGIITQVDVVEQTHDLRQFEEVLIKNVQWDYVILLARSLVAAELSDRIYSNSSPIILGTKFLGSSDLPAFFSYLKNKKIRAYFSRQNCSCDSTPGYLNLRRNYIQTFGVEPMSISIDTYDATKLILKSLMSSKLNSEQVISFMNSKAANFAGASSLKVSEGLKLNTSKRFLIKIDETGYKEVK